ncbi:MAG: hypothetical protein CVV47_10585 [Spirochaetae bacterium HGW-Spirochaetae-3]|jgi:hypothetical protein|nr:MAG: hypothetical protein CVV47_10585 [Spirochaetae bacterium HGW-Spirochaetae-3]
MKSLLKKAGEIRVAAGSELRANGDFTFDAASGISAEDQKVILLHIDRVSRSSRILAGPDTWKVKPRKRGIALPLVVNLAGLLILAGGLYGITLVFRTSGEATASGSELLSSAEGRLLQEIKREAEGRILEKDREIATIQQRMASLDKERDQLLASVESRVKAKEEELRSQLQVELERERERLVAEGLSDAVIQERLREFERRKTEEFRTQLDVFAKKAEADRVALQANLDRARDEYRKELSDLTVERQRIQDESRLREQQLRVQLDDRNKALEAERAKTADSLRSAQAELARWNEDSSRAKSAEDRLVGLYAAIRQSLRDGRLDDAQATLASLRAYLADPQVAVIAGLQPRRELDLFAVDLIERTISQERTKSSVDTTRVTASMDALAVVRDETGKARAALAAGDAAGAGAAYRRALSATRELEEAGAFIEGSWKARLAEQASELGIDEASVKAALGGVEASAEDGAALETAFSRLLSNLPIGPGDASLVYGYVKSAGARDAEAARRSADTTAATVPLRRAAAAYSDGRLLEAIRGYSSVLSRYPSASQSARAAEGVNLSATRLATALEDSEKRAAARVAELETSLAAARRDIAALNEKAPGASSGAAAAGTPSAAPPAAATAGGTADGATRAEISALQEEKARTEAALAEATARYEAVASAYRAYSAEEDAILGRGGDLAIVEARSKLDAFLSSADVSEAMPGMRDRIARYLESFQAAGQREVLFNAADIVDGASRIRDAATRDRYFRDLEGRYAGNESMLEFLATVRAGFR